MNGKLVMATFLIFLLIGVVGSTLEVSKIEANETIYIMADGSIDPPTANITNWQNVTYTFTDNINDSIVILRSNIIIDGAGYTLNGTGIGIWYGFKVEGYMVAVNVTIKNVNIVGCEVGIGLISTNDNKILECNITNCAYGIRGAETWNNTISGNVISNNTYGIYFNTLFDTEIFGNIISDNDNGVWLEYFLSKKSRFLLCLDSTTLLF